MAAVLQIRELTNSLMISIAKLKCIVSLFITLEAIVHAGLVEGEKRCH